MKTLLTILAIGTSFTALAADQTYNAETIAANEAAMHSMHTAMSGNYSGNADIDFARHMIPHHLGAIEMAKIELQYGTNPELRKMAQSIIAAQETEIQQMQNWLATNDK